MKEDTVNSQPYIQDTTRTSVSILDTGLNAYHGKELEGEAGSYDDGQGK